MIQPVLQSPGQRTCGQCCVAMILGITREEAIALVGKKGGTRIVHLGDALKKRGWGVGTKIRYTKSMELVPPCLSLVNIRFRRDGHVWTHWMLWDADREQMHCPDRGLLTIPSWAKATARGQDNRITHFYPLTQVPIGQEAPTK